MVAQSPRSESQRSAFKDETISEKMPNEETLLYKMPQHEINKTTGIIAIVGAVALLFMASR